MKINREEFVELLVQKTGFKKDHVEEQLSKLISEIHETTGKGERYTIPGFGSFVVAEDQLRFVPAEPLRVEVNHKYAGMQPIELISTYDKSEEEELPAVPPEEEADGKKSDAPLIMRREQVDEDIWPAEEDIWGWDGDEAREQEEPEAQPASAEEEESAAEAEKAEASPVGEDQDKDAGDEGDHGVEIPSKEEEGADTEKPAHEPPVESPLAAKKEKLRREKKKTSSLPLILVAAAMVIVIAVSSWFLYDMGMPADQGSPSGPAAEEDVGQMQEQPTQSPQNSETAEGTENDPPSGEAARGADDPDSEPSGQKSVADNEPGANTSIYGLKGNLNSEANDGYTIVILSMRDRQRAKDIFDKMNQKGYRTLIVSAIVSGEKYWRVGVGQFETIPDAQKNAKRLPAPYNDNFFIKRIL